VVINFFNFLGIINLLRFHTVIRIYLISLSYHILVILPSHFSSMEQMSMLMLMNTCEMKRRSHTGQWTREQTSIGEHTKVEMIDRRDEFWAGNGNAIEQEEESKYDQWTILHKLEHDD